MEVAEADNEPKGLGYALAILVSAVGHAGLAALVFVVLPAWFTSPQSAPPVYTVKIFDQLPAGDLGTHLPKLSGAPPRSEASKPEPPKAAPPEERAKTELPIFENDKTAIALNTFKPSPEVAPTPTPTPTPTAQPVAAETPKPPSTPAATPAPKVSRKKPLEKPTPSPRERAKQKPKPKAAPTIEVAKAEKPPSVKKQLEKVREQLLAQHLAQLKKAPPPATAEKAENEDDEEGEESEAASSSGPVAATTAMEGKGAGIGPGSGSAGVQQNLDFLLYYREVQQRIKKAWSFYGGNSELTTTASFAIGSDGGLEGVKITKSSHDPAFDDSVLRAIRRAAPFPPPPKQYQGQFAAGIEAVFKLGELSS